MVVDCFIDIFIPWSEPEDELSDVSDPDPESELELESELEEDTAFCFGLFAAVRGLLPSSESESESESELELESGLGEGFALHFEIFVFSSSSSSSESESELELEEASEDDVESFFSLKRCFLFLSSGSTSDSSLESDSSEDSSSSSTSSVDESVLLESRRDSSAFATGHVAFWGVLSSESWKLNRHKSYEVHSQ